MSAVAGLVTAVRAHPRGDRIWLADVDTGDGRRRQVVWGGVPVVRAGCMVAVALPGARLPGGRIRRRRYRGQVSDGMLCSLAELGWDHRSRDRVALLDGTGMSPGDLL